MDYQVEAMKTAHIATVDYPFEGLSEEVGEVAGKISKYMRKHGVTKADTIQDATEVHELCHIEPSKRDQRTKDIIRLHDDLVKELGDVQWFLAACCHVLGITITELQERNIKKLRERDSRGLIIGSGDNR